MSEREAVRVLVAADLPVARVGLEAMIATDPALLVVGAPALERDAPAAALAAAIDATQPDVVLLELESHDDEALAVLDALDARTRGCAVVVVSDAADGWAADALRRGARGVLPRRVAADELAAAVRAASAGLVVLHPALVEAGVGARPAPARLTPSGNAPPALTPRELQVLDMLAEGLGNKQIAARLRISEHTVKAHLAAIFAKLDVGTRTEAVTVGARLGVIML